MQLCRGKDAAAGDVAQPRVKTEQQQRAVEGLENYIHYIMLERSQNKVTQDKYQYK